MSTNGTNTWLDTEAGQQLQKRLTDERTLRALDRLLDRIETLEQGFDRLTATMEQMPGLVSIATDSLDEALRNANENGVVVEQRLQNALQLADQLTQPQRVAQMQQLFTLLDQMPGLVSMGADAADEAVKQLSNAGFDVEERLQLSFQAFAKLTEPNTIQQLTAAMDFAKQAPGLAAMTMDIVDETFRQATENGLDDLLQFVAKTGAAFQAAQQQAPTPLGMFGLLKALNDPDRQKALGFLMNFLKHLGSRL